MFGCVDALLVRSMKENCLIISSTIFYQYLLQMLNISVGLLAEVTPCLLNYIKLVNIPYLVLLVFLIF